MRVYKGHRISGIITEVEAYLGTKDRACHTYGERRTARTEAMYLPGGHAYIYLIYGIHHCFNIVTQAECVPEAVLIRSLEPVEGLSYMEKFRKTSNAKNLATGPGKLAQALHLNREWNGVALTSDEIFLENGETIPPSSIVKTTRIGVAYAKEHAAWPLRFYNKNSVFISAL